MYLEYQEKVKKRKMMDKEYMKLEMPTREHRRRHQITQLAFDARVQELEYLEEKGNAIKTKREVNARYGW